MVIGDLIFLEILQGFQVDKDYEQAKNILLPLEQYKMFGNSMIEKCANNYRSLRKKADVIIATFCIEQQIPLLFLDRDFLPFVEHLKLQTISL